MPKQILPHLGLHSDTHHVTVVQNEVVKQRFHAVDDKQNYRPYRK